MKGYTDIKQSKKLAEILPTVSADMWYWEWPTAPKYNDYKHPMFHKGDDIVNVPCWSLAALLKVLPDEISMGEGYQNKYEIKIRKYYGGNNITLYQIAYGNNKGSSGSWHDMISTSEQEKFVDACYEMILKLKEKNLL